MRVRSGGKEKWRTRGDRREGGRKKRMIETEEDDYRGRIARGRKKGVGRREWGNGKESRSKRGADNWRKRRRKRWMRK